MSHWSITAEEFTERYSLPTAWPFSTAMTLSLAIHGVLVIAVLFLLDQNITPTPPVFNTVFDVTLNRANANSDSGKNSELVSDSLSLPQEQVALALRPSAQQSPENVEVKTIDVRAESEQPPPTAVEQDPSIPVLQNLSNNDVLLTTEAASHWQLSSSNTEEAEETDFAEEQAENQQQVLVETKPVTIAQSQMLSQHLQQKLCDPELNQTEFTWEQGQQVYAASITQQPAQNHTDLERAFVEISTDVDGVRMTTQMGFKRLAFSHYAQLVDRWDQDVSLSEDEINGRFHSNSRLVVAPDRRKEPKFTDKVTVASSVTMKGFSRRSEVFLGGLETRVNPIRLPQHLSFISEDEENTGDLVENYLFDQDGQVELLVEGGFNWSDESSSQYYDCANPCYIKAAKNVSLSIEGVISGTVLVAAEEKIRITGNLLYKNSLESEKDNTFEANNLGDIPLADIDQQDFLGLLSDNYIEIAPPAITGPGDITIHGALFAKRRFVVRNFRNRNRGLLSIFGSLTAGSVSATEPRFATRIDFDSRFEQQRLPNFPMTDNFELESWDQQWTVEPQSPVASNESPEKK